MVLLDLPDEILLDIIKETIPEHFEDFALSCKATYRICGQFLLNHNRLRKRFRHFSYDRADCVLNGEDDIACYSPFQLLTRIADDPIISRYIVSADFRPLDAPVGLVMKEAADHPEASPNLLRLLQGSLYLKRVDVDALAVYEKFKYNCENSSLEDSLATLYHVSNQIAFFILLTLLPNAIDLALHRDWSEWRRLDLGINQVELLNDIANEANNNPCSRASLSKLTTILPSTGFGYDKRRQLSSFVPFLTIRSVRNFYTGSCLAINDGRTEIPFELPYPYTFHSSLEVVELAGTAVDPTELKKFLTGLPRLRSLKLCFEVKWHGCGGYANAAAIMDAIEENTCETLETLSFSLLWYHGGRESGVKSMKRFKRLKEAELDINWLRGPPMEEHHVRWRDSEKFFLSSDIPHLVDILPSSIEKLILLVEKHQKLPERTSEMNKLFENIAPEKDRKLPNLKEIVIRNGEPKSRQNTPPSSPRFDASEWLLLSPTYSSDSGSSAVLDNSTNIPEDLSDSQELAGWKDSLEALGPSVKVTIETVRLRTGFKAWEAPLMAGFMHDFEQRFRAQIRDCNSLEYLGLYPRLN